MGTLKRWKNIIALILAVFLAFLLCACNPDWTGGYGQEAGQPNTQQPGSGHEADDPKPDPAPKEPDEEEKAKLYGYTPVIEEVMPRISIDTVSKSNYFATYPNRDVKLREVIEYEEATISVSNCESKYELNEAKAQVKARGNYTLNYEKKPLRIKFDKKNMMLGLNNDAKCKSWVLLADWKDLSALNNATSFYLGKTILGSDGYYCTDYRHVEVYLNGQYWGVYLLAEQQQVNEHRVNVTEPASGYTGTDIGYLMEFDGYYFEEKPELGGDPTFTMNYNFSQKGYTLKSDIYSPDQVNFIRLYMNNAYKIAYEAASDKEAVASVIDIRSLVNTYILSEIACDPDIAWSSFYMSVDMGTNGGKKLVFEAPWDYDSAFGIRSGYMNGAVGMYASASGNPWLSLLSGQPWFKDMVKTKWRELVEYGVLEKSLTYIAEYADTYRSYFAENFTRWQSRLIYGNGELVNELNGYKNKDTAEKMASLYLERWLTARYDYLNGVFGNGEPLTPQEEVDETIPEGASAYRFEAENALLTGGIALRAGNGASGDGYLGNVSGGAGKTITFTVHASAEAPAYLYIGLSKRNFSAYISSWFTVSVNSRILSLPQRLVPALSDGEENWHAWTGVKIMRVNLLQGQNTIVLTTAATETTNVDYIELYAAVPLDAQ